MVERASRPLSNSPSSLLFYNKCFFSAVTSLVALPLLLWGSGQLSFLVFIFISLLVVHDSSSLRLKRTQDSKIAVSSSVFIEIDMNSNSTLYPDIHRILHFSDESKIAIYFNKQRNCAHPQLIGRLSGRALATVMWEKSFFLPEDNDDEGEDMAAGNLMPYKDDNNNGTMWDLLIGHYHVPLPGTYFLEIIAIMCEDLLYDSNFTETCLVDPSLHRLTQDDVFINASSLSSSMTLQLTHHNKSNNYHDAKSDGNSSSEIIGYWWYDTESQNESSFIPLHTRYQPQFCRDTSNVTSDRCRLATDLSRFDHYQFKFSSSEFHDEQLSSILEGKTDTICVEGASHARRLRNHMGSVLAILKATTIDITPTPNETRFASDIDEEKINSIIARNCTKVIIGSGQWDAGWPNGHPTLFPEYEQTLNITIPLMLKMFTDANVQVYYRSTQCVLIIIDCRIPWSSIYYFSCAENISHANDVYDFCAPHLNHHIDSYNPLGDIISSCPPTDWRSPRVIDMYNTITERVCNQYGMPWINTNDIMGIVWDRAADWCHYDDVSSDMEARYILGKIYEQWWCTAFIILGEDC